MLEATPPSSYRSRPSQSCQERSEAGEVRVRAHRHAPMVRWSGTRMPRLCSNVVIGLQVFQQLVDGCAPLLRGGGTSTLTAFEEHATACALSCVGAHTHTRTQQGLAVVAEGAVLIGRLVGAQDALVDQAKLDVFLQPLVTVAAGVPLPADTRALTHTHTHTRICALRALTQLMLKADAQALEHHVSVLMPLLLRIVFDEFLAFRRAARPASASVCESVCVCVPSPVLAAADETLASIGSALNPATARFILRPILEHADARGWTPHVFYSHVLACVDGSARVSVRVRARAAAQTGVQTSAVTGLRSGEAAVTPEASVLSMVIESDVDVDAACEAMSEAAITRAHATARGFSRKPTLSTPTAVLLLRHLARVDEAAARAIGAVRARQEAQSDGAVRSDHVHVRVGAQDAGDLWRPMDASMSGAIGTALGSMDGGVLPPALQYLEVSELERQVDQLRLDVVACVRRHIAITEQTLAPWLHEVLGALVPMILESTEQGSAMSALHEQCSGAVLDIAAHLRGAADVARCLTEVLEWYTDHLTEFIHLHPRFSEIVRSVESGLSLDDGTRGVDLSSAFAAAMSRAAVRLHTPTAPLLSARSMRSLPVSGGAPSSVGEGLDSPDVVSTSPGTRLSLRRPSISTTIARALDSRSIGGGFAPDGVVRSVEPAETASDTIAAAQRELHDARWRLLRVALGVAHRLRCALATVSTTTAPTSSGVATSATPLRATHRATSLAVGDSTEAALMCALQEGDARLRALALCTWHELFSTPFPVHEFVDGTAAWTADAEVARWTAGLVMQAAPPGELTTDSLDGNTDHRAWLLDDAKNVGLPSRVTSVITFSKGTLSRLHSALYHEILGLGVSLRSCSASAVISAAQKSLLAEALLVVRCCRSALRATGYEGLWRLVPLAWSVQSASRDVHAAARIATAGATPHDSGDSEVTTRASVEVSADATVASAAATAQVSVVDLTASSAAAPFERSTSLESRFLYDVAAALIATAASAVGTSDVLIYLSAVGTMRAAWFGVAPLLDFGSAAWPSVHVLSLSEKSVGIAASTDSADVPPTQRDGQPDIWLDTGLTAKCLTQSPELRRALRGMGLPVSLDVMELPVRSASESVGDAGGDSGESTRSAERAEGSDAALSPTQLRRIRETMITRAEHLTELGLVPRAVRHARSFSDPGDEIAAARVDGDMSSALAPTSPKHTSAAAITAETLMEELEVPLSATLRVSHAMLPFVRLLVLQGARASKPQRRPDGPLTDDEPLITDDGDRLDVPDGHPAAAQRGVPSLFTPVQAHHEDDQHLSAVMAALDDVLVHDHSPRLRAPGAGSVDPSQNALLYALSKTGRVLHDHVDGGPKLVHLHELERLPADLGLGMRIRQQHVLLQASLSPALFRLCQVAGVDGRTARERLPPPRTHHVA